MDDSAPPLTEQYRDQLQRLYGPDVAAKSTIDQHNGHYFVAVAWEDQPDNVPLTLSRERMEQAVAELARRRSEW
jgi:hypothetical protein